MKTAAGTAASAHGAVAETPCTVGSALVTALALLMAPHHVTGAAIVESGIKTLANSHVTIAVAANQPGNRPGEIVTLASSSHPNENVAEPGVFCGLKSGSYIPDTGTITVIDSSCIEFRSARLVSPTDGTSLPIAYRCRYRLRDERLVVSMWAIPTATVTVTHGLELDFHVSRWQSAKVANHYRSSSNALSSITGLVRCHMDGNIAFSDENQTLRFLIRNPSWAISQIERLSVKYVYWRYFLLQSEPPISYDDPNFTATKPVCSSLMPGDTIHREIEISLTDGNRPAHDIAFSPHPNGYEQTLALMLDELNGIYWAYAVDTMAANLTDAYILRLMYRHPELKVGYLMGYDMIMQDMAFDDPSNPVPWEWHGSARIATNAPDHYRQYLLDVQSDSPKYDWSNRMRLGTHAYHHDRVVDGQFMYHEFSTDDSVLNFNLFDMIVQDMDSIGLTPRSRRFIRYPGFKYSISALQAAIQTGHVYYDNGKRYHFGDLLFYLSLVYYNGKRAWGTNTCWWGDWCDWPGGDNYPEPIKGRPYEYMDYPLAEGKVCLTGAHPTQFMNYPMIDGNTRGLDRVDSMLTLAESKYPGLGYVFPDQIADCLDELYELSDITQISQGPDTIRFSFEGGLHNSQTIAIPRPVADAATSVMVDGVPINLIERATHSYAVLPDLDKGRHEILLTGAGVADAKHAQLRDRSVSRLFIDGIRDGHFLVRVAGSLSPDKTMQVAAYELNGRCILRKRVQLTGPGYYLIELPRTAAGCLLLSGWLPDGQRVQRRSMTAR